MIEDTSKRDPMLHLLGSMGGGGTSGYIEEIEAAGQAQIVGSDRLPVRMLGCTVEDFTALGFTFGHPDPADELFRPVQLPEGWSREGSDHAMWSYIVDQHKRRRVSVFYKAVFYDRKAHCSIDSVQQYLSHATYEGARVVLDEAWATRDVVRELLPAVRDQALEMIPRWDEDGSYTKQIQRIDDLARMLGGAS